MDMLVNQARVFAATVAIGMSIGLLFDYYRAISAALRLKARGILVGDMLFWLVATAMGFMLLLWGNWGELRFYVLLGLGLGALLYFQMFSKFALRLFLLKMRLLQRTWFLLLFWFSRLWLVVTYPLRLLLLVISYPYWLLRRMIHKATRVVKSLWNRLIGRRAARAMGVMKQKCAGLIFWKKKDD